MLLFPQGIPPTSKGFGDIAGLPLQ